MNVMHYAHYYIFGSIYFNKRRDLYKHSTWSFDFFCSTMLVWLKLVLGEIDLK